MKGKKNRGKGVRRGRSIARRKVAAPIFNGTGTAASTFRKGIILHRANAGYGFRIVPPGSNPPRQM